LHRRRQRRQIHAGYNHSLSTAEITARVVRLFQRHAAGLALAFTLVGTLRIEATYTVFNPTADEPDHLACGMELLVSHQYKYETQHPPLTRIFIALGPYLAGATRYGYRDRYDEGVAIYYLTGHYNRYTVLSRVGNLPFFWLGCWITFLWGRRLLGKAGAAAAVLIFTMIPTLLAHAALATTDMGATACLAAAFYAWLRWIEEPNARTGAWMGLSLALAILAKLSSLVFYPAGLLLLLGLWLSTPLPGLRSAGLAARRRLGSAAVAGAVLFLAIWAGYFFSVGHVQGLPFNVPFPELFDGVRAVAQHNAEGHASYLLGEVKNTGWWYFFPLLLLVKLPIAVLVLLAAGLFSVILRRGRGRISRAAQGWPLWIALALPGSILAVAIPSRINLGTRHIMPMFPFLAVIAAAGLIALLQWRRSAPWPRWAAAAMVAYLCISSMAAHPDYLAYFNAFAGSRPERIVVDSELDWGQDVKRLAKRLNELNANTVAFTAPYRSEPAEMGMPRMTQSDYRKPAPGWNAVAVSEWKLYRMGLRFSKPGEHTWPDFYTPKERVGKTILLYYFPP
jgi:4-amino-4-deoxy-L-arabinose transferase-like glycosyltransferase